MARFTLTKQDEQTAQLDWKYFDPGYGLKFRVIFSGAKDTESYVTGEVLGAGKFYPFHNVSSTGKKSIRSNKTSALFSNIALLIITLALVFTLIVKRTIQQSRKKEWFFGIEMLTYILIFTGACAFFSSLIHDLMVLYTIPFD